VEREKEREGTPVRVKVRQARGLSQISSSVILSTTQSCVNYNGLAIVGGKKHTNIYNPPSCDRAIQTIRGRRQWCIPSM
jgi:hypothetical protein